MTDDETPDPKGRLIDAAKRFEQRRGVAAWRKDMQERRDRRAAAATSRPAPPTGPEDGSAAPGPDGPAPEVRSITGIKHSHYVRNLMLAIFGYAVTPNMITVFRGLLLLPIVAFIRTRSYGISIALLAFSLLLDFVDGALAVAQGSGSQVGEQLDPFVDKIVIYGTLCSVMDQVWDMDRLSVAIVPILVFMIMLGAISTVMRFVVHLRGLRPRRTGKKQVSVAANHAGKLKMMTESVGAIVLLIGLAIPLVDAVRTGLLALAASLPLAILSITKPRGT